MTVREIKESGAWVTLEVGYVDPQRRSCAFCGRPLATKVWREEVAGNMLDFCDPDHVARYYTYWLPLYGETKATSS